MTLDKIFRALNRRFRTHPEPKVRFDVLPRRAFSRIDPLFMRGMLHG